MAVNVDEIVSNVIPEPEEQSGASDAGSEPGWKRAAQIRALHALNVCDRTRTSAEGFDD
jgi:hypothetical protein